MREKLFILLILLFCVFENDALILTKAKEDNNVGCVICHPTDDTKINVHLIPHSHDDVGWIKTVDEYFYGVNDGAVSVQQIITTVVEALKESPHRRFIQVETAFFYKWWTENEVKRDDFQMLVNNGQIEMVNGAWSMNDEACVNYQSTIDQFTWGLRKLDDTLGRCGKPRVGWQIDPFGHSREHVSILSQMGFDGVFFARMDHDDKDKRVKTGDLDFLWQGSANLDDSIIFGSCFPTVLYDAPLKFCWDILCADDQIVDDIDSPIYNLPEKVEQFEKVLEKFASYYPKNVSNIIIPMGGDFQYQGADKNFLNMDRLIKGFENNTKYNLIYSTPSCYIKAVNEAKPSLTLKTDDFFPYSERNNSFWTGYYTSRPTVKRFERTGHNILQAAKQIYALSSNRSFDHKLDKLREAMGVLQHHDAVSGTEKQHVSNDYVRMLTSSIKKAEQPMGTIISDILQSNLSLQLSTCLLSNMSICHISQNNEKIVAVIYNPLSWNTTHYVRLPVEDGEYEIKGPDGDEIYDLIEALYSFDYVNLTDETPATHEIVFAARQIPPMGFKVYHIQKLETGTNFKTKANTVADSSVFKINEKTNLLESVTLNGVSLNINQNFYYYLSSNGLDDAAQVTAGAYVFRPVNNTVTAFPNAIILRTFSGNLTEEIHQKWDNEIADVYQSIRWYKNENYLEFDWIVGDINLDLITYGKEIISRFTISDFDNKNTFYTDSNGREMLKRVKNYRPTYTYNSSQEPIASNYYPVTSKIVLKDEKQNLEVALLTDRSQGGTSLENGQFELMVHRRLIFDDNKGVDENLDETEFSKGLYARGSHYLIFGKINQASNNTLTTAAQERILAQKKLVEPWVGLTGTNLTFNELNSALNLTYSALQEELPENVNILTLEPWSENTYLLRLEHIMEKDEDPVLSKPVNISDITTLFKGFEVKEVTETALAGHITLDELQARGKYSWNLTNSSKDSETDGIYTLNPMQIRTFILKINSDSNSGNLKMFNFFSSTILLSLLRLF